MFLNATHLNPTPIAVAIIIIIIITTTIIVIEEFSTFLSVVVICVSVSRERVLVMKSRVAVRSDDLDFSTVCNLIVWVSAAFVVALVGAAVDVKLVALVVV